MVVSVRRRGEVNVEVNHGEAILTGSVDSISEESAAIENAFEGGAVVVSSRLEIEDTDS